MEPFPVAWRIEYEEYRGEVMARFGPNDEIYMHLPGANLEGITQVFVGDARLLACNHRKVVGIHIPVDFVAELRERIERKEQSGHVQPKYVSLYGGEYLGDARLEDLVVARIRRAEELACWYPKGVVGELEKVLKWLNH